MAELNAFKIIQLCNDLNVKGGAQECGWQELLTLSYEVIMFSVYISAVLGTLTFAYAGFLMLTANGNSGQIEKAKGMFWMVIKGIVIVLCAYLFTQTFLGLFGLEPGYSLLLPDKNIK